MNTTIEDIPTAATEPVAAPAAANEEISPRHGHGSVTSQLECAEQTEPPRVSEPDRPNDGPGGRRSLLKFLVLLLVVGAGAVYVYRDRLGLGAVESAATSGERKILYWVDPMHPSYTSDKPGIAPDCGMDLVPVYADGAGESVSNLPPGVVHISAEKQQLVGVKLGVVESRNASRTLRAVGKVAYDETRVTHVHARFEGWVEAVDADFTGKYVTKGQRLLEIYSPELYATQQELLLARKGREELKDSPYESVATGAESLYQAARHRLEQWDVPVSEIDEIERRGVPTKRLPVLAPASGFVTSRNAYLEQRVMPDTDLYTIADLSTVWIMADVYEYEAADVHVGQNATVRVSAYPGKTFRGRISYIYPDLNAETRTLRVRVDVANGVGLLKPEMYADVELGVESGTQLLVPEEAVLVSGGRQTVFVALEGGYFEPRAVTLGSKTDGAYVVLSGLVAGEKIVTSGNFLIDSESRLKSAMGGMGAPTHDHGAAPATGGSTSEGHSRHGVGAAPAVDHSRHEAAGQATDAPEDHSGHAPPAAPAPVVDHSKMDHSQHEAPKPATSHEGHKP